MTASNPVAVLETRAHFRALLLCDSSEPHTKHRPCDRCVAQSKRQWARAEDVARVRQ